MSRPRALLRNLGDESDGVHMLTANDEYVNHEGFLTTGILNKWKTPIPEWADAIQDPEHPPEYVMAPKSMDRPRIEYPTGVKGTRMVLEDVIAIGLASGGLTAIYERLPNQPEVLRRVWMREAVAAKPELAPNAALAWTRVDAPPAPTAPPEPDATSEFADVYSAADVARAIADGFRLAAPNLRARPDSGALICENEAPDTPADGYTISDVTPHPFDATAYAQRLERERREFDCRVAYQTPWPQEESDAAHERARLSRIADEIARRAGR